MTHNLSSALIASRFIDDFVIDEAVIFRRSSNFAGDIRNIRKINFSSISVASFTITSYTPFSFLSANIFHTQNRLLYFFGFIFYLYLCKAKRQKQSSGGVL